MYRMPDNAHDLPAPPRVDKRRGISLVWLVPVVAALVGLAMLMHAWLAVGPQITLTFQTATGLEAGKTPVKYKDVTVGSVSSITLSDDRSHVRVTASLVESAASLAREDSRFWVVRPRIGARGISGVDTLLSGAYIGVDAGTSITPANTFIGLESPPTLINGMPGKVFTVRTAQLDSLDIDSPVYYRDIKVGRVVSYQLDSDGQGVSLQVFIDEPYARFVTTDTRFWNASGVSLSLGAEGLKVRTQSMAAIVAGGIAFASPDGSHAESAPAHSSFTLEQDQPSAMAQADGPAHSSQLRFDHMLEQLASIIGKVDKLPLEAIARHLDATLLGLDQTLHQVNEQVLPQTTQTLQQAHKTLGVMQRSVEGDAPIPQALGQSLQEVKRAATAFRVLTDLLSRHPESLLRGRPDDQPVPRATQVSQELSP